MKKDLGKIIEVTFRYGDHIIIFHYNVRTLEEFKDTLGYKLFKNQFGDVLRENVLINDNKEFIQPEASIILSIAQRKPSKEDFESVLNKCMVVFDIPFRYQNQIQTSILESYPKNKKMVLLHSVVIINDFEQEEQHIEFSFTILKKKKSQEHSFYSQNIITY